jgi:ribA/ribD-fused uncharacterized protein
LHSPRTPAEAVWLIPWLARKAAYSIEFCSQSLNSGAVKGVVTPYRESLLRPGYNNPPFLLLSLQRVDFESTLSNLTACRLTSHMPVMATSSMKAEDSSPIYFWREYGEIYGYLSQWYHSPFHTDNDSTIVYQTAEQYMMHQKAILFSDHEIAAQILKTTVPKEQKALGRRVSNFNQEVWEANRERIVEEGSYFKFKYGEDEGEGKDDGTSLREKLLGTCDREIVEASPMVSPDFLEY